MGEEGSAEINNKEALFKIKLSSSKEDAPAITELLAKSVSRITV